MKIHRGCDGFPGETYDDYRKPITKEDETMKIHRGCDGFQGETYDDYRKPITKEDNSMNDVKTIKPRGFAALPSEVVSAIASKGGKRAHELKTAHEFTSEEARAAGKKGAIASAAAKRAKKEQERLAAKGPVL